MTEQPTDARLYQIQYRRGDGPWKVYHTYSNSAAGVYISKGAVKGIVTARKRHFNSKYFEYRIVTAVPEWKGLEA